MKIHNIIKYYVHFYYTKYIKLYIMYIQYLAKLESIIFGDGFLLFVDSLDTL